MAVNQQAVINTNRKSLNQYERTRFPTVAFAILKNALRGRKNPLHSPYNFMSAMEVKSLPGHISR